MSTGGDFLYKAFLKRSLDVAFSFICLLVFLPFFLIIALAVKIDSKGPVLFRQQRIGKDGKVFVIYKFRSMCENAEFTGSGVYSESGDVRVTRVGRFLRATSLDELPQLLNIFLGQMSLIGPRPPLTYHPWPIEEYTDEQKKMFSVRPGVTGWAQINGRKAVEWNKRIELNVWYVEHLSFWLDARIFFATFLKVLRNTDNVNTGATVAAENAEESATV